MYFIIQFLVHHINKKIEKILLNIKFFIYNQMNNNIQNIIANYKPCIRSCSGRTICAQFLQLLDSNRPQYNTYSIKNILQYINNDNCNNINKIIYRLYSDDHHSDSVEDIINKFKKSTLLFNNICESLCNKGNNNPIILARAAIIYKGYNMFGDIDVKYYEDILNKLLIIGEHKYINTYFKNILLPLRVENRKGLYNNTPYKNNYHICINKMINIYINKCPVIQTSQILDNVSDIIDRDNLEYFIKQKINPSKKCFSNFLHNINYDDLVNIFIANGYEIDIDDILKSIKMNIIMSNIEHLNITDPEDKICEYAAKYNFHKYHKIIKYNYTLQSLYIACETRSINNIKYIIGQGIKPDKKCLDIACTKESNALIVKYFIENHKIKPNIDTFNIYIENSKNATLILLKNNIEM